MNEEYELLIAFAEKRGMGSDFTNWVGLCDGLVRLLSDPYQVVAREQIFELYNRDGLPLAQLETLCVFQKELREGKIRGPSSLDARRLLSKIDWSDALSSRWLYYASAEASNLFVDFANRHRFIIWDQVKDATRRDLLDRAVEHAHIGLFLSSIGSPEVKLTDMKTREDLNATGPPNITEPILEEQLLSHVVESYLDRRKDTELRKAVSKALSIRGWKLCESLIEWDRAYDILSSHPIDDEEYNSDFIRFLLCCACGYNTEANPSLTIDAVKQLVGSDNLNCKRNRIQKLLSPFQEVYTGTQPVGFSVEILVTWLFKLIATMAAQHDSSEKHLRKFWSVVEILDAGKEPDLKGSAVVLPFAARVIRDYPAIGKTIDHFLTVPDTPQCVSLAIGRFVFAAGIVAGCDPEGIAGIPNLPPLIYMSINIARGISANKAVRKLLEPEQFRKSSEKQLSHISQIVQAIKEYQEVDKLFAAWLRRLPEQTYNFSPYLNLMTSLLGAFRSGIDEGDPMGSVFWIPLSEKDVFRMNADVHPAFARQTLQFLQGAGVDYSSPTIDRTPSYKFQTDAMLLGALAWLDVQKELVDPMPEWVEKLFMKHSRLSFDALRLGTSGKGPFAGLPANQETNHFMNICSGLLSTLRDLGLMQVALKPLLLGFRSLTVPGVPVDLSVSRNSVFSAEDPARAFSKLVHMTLYQPRKADFNGGAKARNVFTDYLLSRFDRRRTPYSNNEISGWDPDTMECDPFWREAYVHALVDLRANPGGKSHRLLYALAERDPSKEVQAAAEKGLETLRHQRNSFADISPKRAMLNAWWWLRRHHLLSLGMQVDEHEARVTRLREVRE